MFIKTNFRYSKNVKKIRNYVSKMQSVSVFLNITKIAEFR